MQLLSLARRAGLQKSKQQTCLLMPLKVRASQPSQILPSFTTLGQGHGLGCPDAQAKARRKLTWRRLAKSPLPNTSVETLAKSKTLSMAYNISPAPSCCHWP